MNVLKLLLISPSRLVLGSTVLLSLLSNPTTTTHASSSSSAAALSAALKNIDYRYFVAGGTCAAFSHGITTPIDVVKTKIQANPKVGNLVQSTATATAICFCMIETKQRTTTVYHVDDDCVCRSFCGLFAFHFFLTTCTPLFHRLVSSRLVSLLVGFLFFPTHFT